MFIRFFGSLIVMSLFVSGLLGMRIASGHDVPDFMVDLWGTCFGCGVLSWMQTDARLNHRTPCFDFGHLLYQTAPLSIPWYLIRTRGWWTLLIIPMLTLLWMLPGIVARLVWEVMYR